MLDQVTFEWLPSNPAAAEIVSRWIEAEWGTNEGPSRSEIRERLLTQENHPATQIALLNGVPIGVISFKRHPVSGRPKNPIWIDAVYVVADFRGQRLGTTLVRWGEQLAAAFERELFVYTESPQLYLRLDWELVQTADARRASVLRKQLPR